jgi:drug/metabolite transporter (DMT)-like permease
VRWNVAVAALAASWGLVAVIVREIDLDAQVLAFYRVAFAAIALFLAAAALRQLSVLRLPRDRLRVAGLGVLLAAHWFVFFAAIKLSSVAVAVLLVYTAPMVIAVLAPLILPESRSAIALVALVPAGAGLALVALGGEGGGHVRPLALAGGLAAALSYALLVIFTKQVAMRTPVLAVTFWYYAVASVAVAPFLLLAPRVLPTSRELPALLALGVVFTALAGFVYVWLIRHVTAQAIGILSYIEPVSAALLAWALLDEPLTWEIVIGGALVITAGLVVVFLEPADAPVPDAALGSTP